MVTCLVKIRFNYNDGTSTIIVCNRENEYSERTKTGLFAEVFNQQIISNSIYDVSKEFEVPDNWYRVIKYNIGPGYEWSENHWTEAFDDYKQYFYEPLR